MSTDPITYLSEAITRADDGSVSSVSGSHLVGIFGKCAKAFEKEIRSYSERLLRACNLDYETDLRPQTGTPKLGRAPLGNLIVVIREAERIRPQPVGKCVPGNLREFLEKLRLINAAWVQVKHGDDVAPAVLKTRMKTMLTITNAIKSLASG